MTEQILQARVNEARAKLEEWWEDYMHFGGKEECAIKCKEGIDKWRQRLDEALADLEAFKNPQGGA